MPGRSPAGPLMKEHRVIERMLDVLDRALESIEDGGSVDPAFIDQAIDFIRTYADRCHHGKEEDILFRRLADKQLDADLAEAMQSLIDDHVHARGLTMGLAEANARYAQGESAALTEITAALRGLIEFYPAHIAKEDKQFFKPCMACFSDDERAQMLADFEDFDRSLIHEKYRLVVEHLEQRIS